MVSALAEQLRDPDVRLAYIMGGMGIMWVPMVWMTIWYHRNIRSSPGGRALMERQAKSRPLAGTFRGAGDAIPMMRDISAGRYGQHARRMQRRVYWVTGLWVTALTIYFGLFLWADELNRVAPG